METRDMDSKVYESVIIILVISIELSLSSNYNRFTIAIELTKHAILINIANFVFKLQCSKQPLFFFMSN